MKTWTHSKTVVHEVIVKQVSLQFLKYDKNFRRVRQDITACGLCDKPFVDNQEMNIAFTTNTVNKLICLECAEEAIGNGVTAHERKKDI